MSDSKLAAVLQSINAELTSLRDKVARIQKVKPLVKDGKDGVSPKIEDIVAAVLAEIPKSKDGESPDPQKIITELLAQVPTPRDGKDGRDAQQVSVADVVSVVLAKLPKPKDGRNGPSIAAVVQRVEAAVHDGKDGKDGTRGPQGEKGVSITNVELNNNELFVFLDGVKKLVGKIKIPAISAPFAPGGGGGGGDPLPADNARVGFFDYNDVATSITPLVIPTGLVNVDIPNDEQGPNTRKNFAPKGVSDVWDALAGRFNWSQLKLGDMVDIRLDLIVTTSSPNQRVVIELVLAEGAGDIVLPFLDMAIKTTGEDHINVYNGIYMGDAIVTDNPAYFRIRSDAAATVVLRGWYTKVLIRG